MSMAVRAAEWEDWARNPDVQEVRQRNREARQNACEHTASGPVWDAICVVCLKNLTPGEACAAYDRMEARP